MRPLSIVPPRLAAISCLALLGAACHSHDDDNNGALPLLPPAGSAGDFQFAPFPVDVRAGELEDFTASLPSGDPVAITSWELITGPGGVLVDLGSDEIIRVIAGQPGFYAFRATDAQGRTGTLGFNVTSSAGTLSVTEVVDGTDADEVFARLEARGEDLFIADRIGDSTAPQRFARANVAGGRDIEVTLPYKVEDLGVDADGNLTTVQAAATLTDALARYDRDLVEQTTFSAPDLGAGESWAERIAMTRDGRTVVVTSLQSGSLLFLDATGAPVTGTVATSLVQLPFGPAEVVDLTADALGAIYVATSTEIVRLLLDRTLDTTNWSPAPREAIIAIDCDDNGVLFVVSQDIDNGQCGSLRKLNWLGGQTGVLTEFSTGTFFGSRKFVRPLDIAAYPDGSWRIYDDNFSIDPSIVQHAAWIVSGTAPPLTVVE